MLVPEQVQEKLKSVSIRGRMAMAISCFENIVRTENLSSPALNELVDILWQFVEVNDLSEWEERAGVMTNPIYDYMESSTPPPPDFKYGYLPRFLLQMITDIVELGCGNLYAGVVGYSSETYSLTLKVLNSAVEHGYPIPPVRPFLRSHFSEFHGWGNRVSRTFFHQGGDDS